MGHRNKLFVKGVPGRHGDMARIGTARSSTVLTWPDTVRHGSAFRNRTWQMEVRGLPRGFLRIGCWPRNFEEVRSGEVITAFGTSFGTLTRAKVASGRHRNTLCKPCLQEGQCSAQYLQGLRGARLCIDLPSLTSYISLTSCLSFGLGAIGTGQLMIFKA